MAFEGGEEDEGRGGLRGEEMVANQTTGKRERRKGGKERGRMFWGNGCGRDGLWLLFVSLFVYFT